MDLILTESHPFYNNIKDEFPDYFNILTKEHIGFFITSPTTLKKYLCFTDKDVYIYSIELDR